MIWIELTVVIWAVAVGSRSTVALNFCDSSSDSDPRSQHIAAKSTAIAGMCYFLIKPESIEPLNICQLSRYAIDIDLGRKVCNNFEATLPMLRTKMETDAIRGMIPAPWKEAIILLGMKKMTDNKDTWLVEWDDGSSNVFSENDKPHGFWHSKGKQVLTGLLVGYGDGDWVSYDTPDVDHFLLLVCQQDLGSTVSRKEQLTLPIPSPLPTPPAHGSSDFCDFTNVENDPRRKDISAAFYSYSGGRIEKCFFSFKVYWPFVKCVGMQNPKESLVIDQARNICKAYSATLPLIKNIDQWNTIGALSPFGLRKDQTYIPLGVQEHSYAEKKIVWDDGTVHMFDGDHPFHGEVRWLQPNAGPMLLMWWNMVGYSTMYSHTNVSIDGALDLICEQDQSHRVSPPPMTKPIQLPDIDFCTTDERISTDPRRTLRKFSTAHPSKGTKHKCYAVMDPDVVQSYYITCPIQEGYQIHSDSARQICESFGGTLPIVKNLDEAATVARMGASIGGKRLLLGIRSVEESNGQIHITWDDDTDDQLSNPIFGNFTWTKSEPGVITVQKLLPCDNCAGSESRTWDNWETKDEYGPLPSLVCEQDFTKAQRRQPSSLPLFMQEIPFTDKVTDFCDQTKAKLDPRNEFIQNRLYYPDPTTDSAGTPTKCFFNFRISWNVGLCHDSEGLKFNIDMNRTRKICNKFSATLPMIRQHEENKYLVALSTAKAGLEKNVSVPLGMRNWEHNSTSQITKIIWDDGTVHSFPPNDPFENQTRWHRSDTETQNVTVLDALWWGGVEWKSILSTMLDHSIVIVCEQDLSKPLITLPPTPVPPVTPTPPTSPPTSPSTIPPTSPTTPNSAIMNFKSALLLYWLIAISSSNVMTIFGQIY